MCLISTEELQTKKDRLEYVRTELKKSFIGIDYVIDELINSIKSWYLMPELLTRPTVVCLFGMTGQGKTDLIRKLVDLLNFNSSYVEIGPKKYGYDDISILNQLHNTAILTGQPFIFLLDEFQRFNSIDEEGKFKKIEEFQDFWELLSDGKISRTSKGRELEDIMIELLLQPEAKSIAAFESKKLIRMFKLKLDNDVTRLKGRDFVINLIATELKKGDFAKPFDASKGLVFVAGNIDSAYSASHLSYSADIDADLLAEKSADVTLLTIKHELLKLFKPEQIARLGNNIITYRCFTKQNYIDIIKFKLNNIENSVFEKTGIKLAFSEKVIDFLYCNGVIPAQGVRPLFSTITNYIENNMPDVLLHCIENNIHRAEISISDDNILTLTSGEELIAISKLAGSIDKIRDGRDEDSYACMAVHEAGHALAYAIEFGVAPQKIKISVASDSQSYVFQHNIFSSKEIIEKQIRVLLAGSLAEELIFGGEISSGGASDLKRLTSLIADATKKYGMFGFYANMEYGLDDGSAQPHILNIIDKNRDLIKDILSINKKALLDLSKLIYNKKEVESQEIFETLKSNNVGCTLETNENYIIKPNYREMLFSASEEKIEIAKNKYFG